MIDTLEFSQRMTAAGMPDKTAQQLAHELLQALPAGETATKADLAELRTEIEKLRTDFSNLRTSFSNLKVWVLLIVGLGQVLPTLLQFIRSFFHS
jgi:hypothetical protein